VEQKEEHMKKCNNSVRFRDGRTGKVEQVSQYGMLWIRDDHGNLSSADPKTGWSGDGNWQNDIELNTPHDQPS